MTHPKLVFGSVYKRVSDVKSSPCTNTLFAICLAGKYSLENLRKHLSGRKYFFEKLRKYLSESKYFLEKLRKCLSAGKYSFENLCKYLSGRQILCRQILSGKPAQIFVWKQILFWKAAQIFVRRQILFWESAQVFICRQILAWEAAQIFVCRQILSWEPAQIFVWQANTAPENLRKYYCICPDNYSEKTAVTAGRSEGEISRIICHAMGDCCRKYKANPWSVHLKYLLIGVGKHRISQTEKKWKSIDYLWVILYIF